VSNADPYDEVEYPGFPFPQTHPDRLATIAILFGMTPKNVTECRVLELGCGEGANLIPIAYGLPRSKFIGIDLAERAIARGTNALAALGLRNIELRRLNVLDVTADFGQFDYIIAHGLFSWVPLQVQEKILTLCEDLLAPQGVAYISYNTYPGSHLRQMTREMMLFHLNAETDPKIRLSKARELIKSMSEAETANDAYSAFLSQEFTRIAERSDAALYHDDLGETNTAYYFSQFMEKARRHGLQYLAEARLAECQNNIYPAIANDLGVAHEDSIIASEQYFDFLKCRMFRQTLLCHESVQVDRSLNIDRLRKLFVASSAQPVSATPDLQSPGVVEKFHLTSGATISIDLPVAKVALAYLGEVWPRSVGVEELLARSHQHLCSRLDVGDSDSDMIGLCEAILKIYGADLLYLHSYQQTIASSAGDDPIASPVARLQARDKSTVTTLRHTTVELKDALGRHLLMLLDGTRNRPALLEELSAQAKRQAGTPSKKVDLEDLERKLGELARLALLVA